MSQGLLSAMVVCLLAVVCGCGDRGGATPAMSGGQIMSLVDSQAVVDLVRITNVSDSGGCIEIGCASQVSVSIVAAYPGQGGQKTVRCDIEPPVTTVKITDFDRESGGKIVLRLR